MPGADWSVGARTTRDELTELSRCLGATESDLVLFAEGNASAATSADRLLVKSSGMSMAALDSDDLVEVAYEPILEHLDRPMSDADWTALVGSTGVGRGRPSIEVPVHAVAIGLCGAAWVAHTHPTAVNAFLCSANPEALTRPLFPDQVVVCGPRYPLVPYTDPGQALGHAFRKAVERHRRDAGEWPKAVLLGNHGLVAIGQSAAEVHAITLMMCKAARIAAGASAAGGVAGLREADVARLDRREDELFRRHLLRGGSRP
jgi:rhamnose utilization protein RhaD (predicted bifunctional aldolase and dehydrogenase)